MAEHSPLPWAVYKRNEMFAEIMDADGLPIILSAFAAMTNADAEYIVEAVNAVDATLKLQRTLLGWTLERDRLRDLVRRLCDELESHYHEPALMDNPCILREAREALGEGEP